MTRADVTSEIPATPQRPVTERRHRPIPAAAVVFGVLLVAAATYVLLAWPFDAGLKVTRDEFGAAWPLTVSDGALRCEFGQEITFQSGGTTYSLSRPATHGAYAGVDPIRADHPAGGKKDLSPLIERGARLCP